MIHHADNVEQRILCILNEMKCQFEQSPNNHQPNQLSLDGEMEQIRMFTEDAGEYSIAYEMIIANLEAVDFVLTGKSAVYLLELGLLMKYKTDLPKDRIFDLRHLEGNI